MINPFLINSRLKSLIMAIGKDKTFWASVLHQSNVPLNIFLNETFPSIMTVLFFMIDLKISKLVATKLTFTLVVFYQYSVHQNEQVEMLCYALEQECSTFGKCAAFCAGGPQFNSQCLQCLFQVFSDLCSCSLNTCKMEHWQRERVKGFHW